MSSGPHAKIVLIDIIHRILNLRLLTKGNTRENHEKSANPGRAPDRAERTRVHRHSGPGSERLAPSPQHLRGFSLQPREPLLRTSRLERLEPTHAAGSASSHGPTPAHDRGPLLHRASAPADLLHRASASADLLHRASASADLLLLRSAWRQPDSITTREPGGRPGS
jgi:hypothetical protein